MQLYVTQNDRATQTHCITTNDSATQTENTTPAENAKAFFAYVLIFLTLWMHTISAKVAKLLRLDRNSAEKEKVKEKTLPASSSTPLKTPPPPADKKPPDINKQPSKI